MSIAASAAFRIRSIPGVERTAHSGHSTYMCDDAARPTEAAIRLGEAVATEAERPSITQGQLIDHM